MIDTLRKSTYMIKCSVFPSFEIISVRELLNASCNHVPVLLANEIFILEQELG